MASEQVLEIVVRRHIFTSNQPFPAVLDGIFGAISQPDIGQLFSKLAASTSYEEFTSLVQQAQGKGRLRQRRQRDRPLPRRDRVRGRRTARRRGARATASGDRGASICNCPETPGQPACGAAGFPLPFLLPSAARRSRSRI